MADRLIATPSQTVGPFFHFGLATNTALGNLAVAGAAGERVTLAVRVLDGDGEPVPDALVELHQADASGTYAPPGALDPQGFSGFGRLATGPDGWCRFTTIKPGPVQTAGATQAPHVNVCLLSRGLLRHVHTRIYFEGDPELHEDPILALVPGDRRGTLMARRAGQGQAWEFVIRMQGQGETVFFSF